MEFVEFAIIMSVVVIICAILAALATIAEIRREKRIFLISPVRNASPEIMAEIEKYVKELENKGYEVFWPKRDNPHQETDIVGIDICDVNFREILKRPKIHIWLAKESTGSIFDSGGVYMLARILKYKKQIVFANKEEFADVIEKPEKSFPKVLDFLEKTTK